MREETTGGEELRDDEHRGEELNIGIVESDVNDHRSCSMIDPREAMK